MKRLFTTFLIAFLTLSIGGVASAKNKCEKLEFSPDPVNFGENEIGAIAKVTEPLTVTNPSKNVSAVDIRSYNPSPSSPFTVDTESSACLGSLAPGGSCTVTVTFTPTKKGKKKGKVHFYITDYPEQAAELTGVGGTKTAIGPWEFKSIR
jgi:hypothetical protein